MTTTTKGRVYRTCTCRDENKKLLGQRCPLLQTANNRHGTWAFAVDLPTTTGKRRTMRRTGYTTKRAAQQALRDINTRQETGIEINDKQTLTQWLDHTLEAR